MRANETFALTWDPTRSYWAGTRDYVEQYLKDVADGSGTGTSPVRDHEPYRDANGAAYSASKYGGACIDYGIPGGIHTSSATDFGSGTGTNYPPSTVQSRPSVCLTDSKIQTEPEDASRRMELVSNQEPGYTPLLVLLTPLSVGTCLDSAGTLCSPTDVEGAVLLVPLAPSRRFQRDGGRLRRRAVDSGLRRATSPS